MLIIQNGRIKLRDWQITEIDQFHSWESDPSVMRYTSWRSHSIEESRTHLLEAVEQSNRIDRTKYFFAIERNNEKEIIGDAGFTIKGTSKNCGIQSLSTI
jgi:RimJ/RimL family protein N-acetyltransferase